RASGGDLLALRPALEAREPWPLSAAYGTEPEADWGPREVLAHVNEMLGYWTTELRRVVAAAPGAAPVPFGRVASDANRIDRIARDRELTVGELLRRIEAGLGDAAAFVDPLTDDDLARLGAHPTRGDISVGMSLDRFIVSHLEEHVRQLRGILDATG
ncbi:MAG TPA: DinB family protein, partial [Candidatus Limnocylindrales bacterium]|nr:DinB family protein [Candidatus Limnocylindrales bacterium]